jgi:hypothetical protein
MAASQSCHTILEREQEVERLVAEIQKEWNKVTNLAPRTNDAGPFKRC